MITFCRGLVLSRGERQIEFERDLGDGRYQFKYLDTFEICTFKASKLYQGILDGEYVPAHIPMRNEVPVESKFNSLPSNLSKEQIEIIDFRMAFVKELLGDDPSEPRTRERRTILCQKAWDKLSPELQKYHKPTASAVEIWVRTYRQSDANPYALVDRRSFVVHQLRIDSATEQIINDAISGQYMRPRGPSVKEVHRRITQEIKKINNNQEEQLSFPSESTLLRRINAIPPYIRDVKRIGSSYAKNKWRYSLKGDQSTRILERVEIDHTLLDIWVLDPRSGMPLGRPWITLVIDRFSKYILGVYISFYGPSVSTVASAIKESIKPKDGYMELLKSPKLIWSAMGCAECYVVDNGLEFHSNQFKRIAWELRSDLIFNPVRSPWYKSMVERYIMESNRMLPLHGKVHHPLANAVGIDPSKTAAIMFNDLCLCMIEWASQCVPLEIDRKNLSRPLDFWEEGRKSIAPPSLPSSLLGMDLLCGLAVNRKVSGDGIFFKYLRFNSMELQDYRRSYERSFLTEIRFNPENLQKIYVYLSKAKSWLTVPLQRPYFDTPISLIQLEIMRAQAGRKLTKNNAEELLLAAQINLRDQWEEATRRGHARRTNKSLVRFQGMTSIPIESTPLALPQMSSSAPLEISPAFMKALPETVPYKAFQLWNEYL